MLNENDDLLNPNEDFEEALSITEGKVSDNNQHRLITESELKAFGNNTAKIDEEVNDDEGIQSNQTIVTEQKNKVLDEILSANASVPLNKEYKLSDSVNELANIAEMQKRIDKLGVNTNEVVKFNDNISPDIATALEKLRREDVLNIPSLETYTPVYSNVNIKEFKYILTKAYWMSLSKFNDLITYYTELYKFNTDWITAVKPNVSNALSKKPLVMDGVRNIQLINKDPTTYSKLKQKMLVSTVYMLHEYLTFLLNEEQLKSKSFEWVLKLKNLYDQLIKNKDPVTISGFNSFKKSKFSDNKYILKNLSIVLYDCKCSEDSDEVTIENVLGVLLELINTAHYNDMKDQHYTLESSDINKVKNAYDANILTRINIINNINIPESPYDVESYVQNTLNYLNEALSSDRLINTINALYITINGYQHLIAALPSVSASVLSKVEQLTSSLQSDDYDRIIDYADSFIEEEKIRSSSISNIFQYQMIYSALIILGDSLIELLSMYGDKGDE